MLLPIKMAARFLKFHPITISRAIKEGRLKAEKYGNLWLIDDKDAMALKRRKAGRPRKAKP